MKNLSEVLDQLPAIQPPPESGPPAIASAALSDEAVEALLLKVSQQQQQRQQLRSPLDPNLLFKFACLGLGAVCAGILGLVAYWNRPVQSLAQAEAMRSMGSALVETQVQVQEAIATANPPQYRCGARLFGDCNFPEQDQQRSPQPTEPPMQPAIMRPARTLEVNHSPVGIGVPVMAAPAPEDAAIAQAQQQLLTWAEMGYGPTQTVEFIQRLRQQPDPQFPAAQHLSVAHVRLYGAQF